MARFRVLIDEWDDCSFSLWVAAGCCDNVCRLEGLGARFPRFCVCVDVDVDVVAVEAVGFFCIRLFLGSCTAMRF